MILLSNKNSRESLIAIFKRGFFATLTIWLCSTAIADNIEIKRHIPDIRLAPGDDKTNYQIVGYKTNSLSLELRKGTTVDLLTIATTKQLGLPKIEFPKDNLPDAQKIKIGRLLFFDRRLSRNKTMSCAMCHIPEQGFTSNEVARPIGFEGRGLKRNAPTILNVAFMPRLFVDARETSLEHQVWSPLLAANEMNNPSIGYVIETIRQSPEYEGLFEQAFGEPPTMENIGMALAQYERTLIAGNSRFDRWYYGNDKEALTGQEVAGFRLFTGKAGCSNCHSIKDDYTLFTDHRLHNTGVGYRDSMNKAQDITVQLAPGVTAIASPTLIASVSDGKPNDLGRYEITLKPEDRWSFRTPTLRNVALTAPYMHNGEMQSLEEVIAFYNQGGIENELLSGLIEPLQLDSNESEQLVKFLQSLNGENLKQLVADAFAVGIGDPLPSK